jgi:hypothetical protein
MPTPRLQMQPRKHLVLLRAFVSSWPKAYRGIRMPRVQMQPRKHEDAKKKHFNHEFFIVLSCLRGQRRTEASGCHEFKCNHENTKTRRRKMFSTTSSSSCFRGFVAKGVASHPGPRLNATRKTRSRSVAEVDGHTLALREAVQHAFEGKFSADPALLETAVGVSRRLTQALVDLNPA